MRVDTTPEQREERKPEAAPGQAPKAPRPTLGQRIGLSFRQIEWGQTLLIALVMALAWCALFLGSSMLQILAGIVPVMAGLFLGRRVKGDYLAHGLVLGLAGFTFGLVFVVGYGLLGQVGIVPLPTLQLSANAAPAPPTLSGLLFFYTTFSLFALIPFPAFGTVMAGRAEERNRQTQREIDERGGRLEKPGVVRTLSDLQGLSLPQLGSFVISLYRKKGFEFKDYHFIDKDKHLDLELTYEGESYTLRLTVADKVGRGTIESLVQDMKRRAIGKGVVIASTEFTPDALKAGKDRKNLVLIDGQTLFDISES
ncbi:MAG: restriction endonuclease [Chloroflexales bacterium]|nr:restriction endonuclease [Chloroflexales bacterium]